MTEPVVYISIGLEELDRAIRFVEKTIANYESLDDGLLDDEDIMSGYETTKLIREKLIEYREVLTHD